MYGAIGGKTRKIKKLYGAIGSTTRNIKKVYGVVGGITKLIYSSATSISFPFYIVKENTGALSAEAVALGFTSTGFNYQNTNSSSYPYFTLLENGSGYIDFPKVNDSYSWLVGRTIKTITLFQNSEEDDEGNSYPCGSFDYTNIYNSRGASLTSYSPWIESFTVTKIKNESYKSRMSSLNSVVYIKYMYIE